MSVDPRLVFQATDPVYLAKCLAQRQPSGGVGSRFLKPTTLEELASAPWEPYTHYEVEAPVIAFKAPIPGHSGVVRLTDLPVSMKLMLDNRKDTDEFEVVYQGELGPLVNYTTLLVGPTTDNQDKLMVWTFFPGDPIPPSKVLVEVVTLRGFKHGNTITVGAAHEMGFAYAKIE